MEIDSNIKRDLVDQLSSKIAFDIALSRYSSLKVGGKAAMIIEVNSSEELSVLLKRLNKYRIIWRVIGKGTNLLVSDSGYGGAILLLGRGFRQIECLDETGKEIRLFCGAGLSLAKLAAFCSEKGFAGLEFAGGIPGSVGGAVVMNAGAWGSELSDCLKSISIATKDGTTEHGREEMGFGYRCCQGLRRFEGCGIVTGATFTLKKDDRDQVAKRCRELSLKRKMAQRVIKPNAGSFFKNPPGTSAGRLIDEIGLKGTRIGGAMVANEHGNFIVNENQATAKDIVALMEFIQEKVYQASGIKLDPEVHFLGSFAKC